MPMGVCSRCGLKEDIFSLRVAFYGMKIGDIAKNVKKHPNIGPGYREGRLLEKGVY